MASKSTDRLCEQFERVMRQAWTDVLELKMREDPPDYDWVIRLYREIRDRLCAVLRKGHRVREDMEAKLDVELFGQMIRNNAFQGPEFIGTVYYVFEKCLMLGAQLAMRRSPPNVMRSSRRYIRAKCMANSYHCSF